MYKLPETSKHNRIATTQAQHSWDQNQFLRFFLSKGAGMAQRRQNFQDFWENGTMKASLRRMQFIHT